MGKGGHSSVWSQRVELSEWVDFADKEADVVKGRIGTFLAVQWLRLHPSNAGGSGSIPGWET